MGEEEEEESQPGPGRRKRKREREEKLLSLIKEDLRLQREAEESREEPHHSLSARDNGGRMLIFFPGLFCLLFFFFLSISVVSFLAFFRPDPDGFTLPLLLPSLVFQ